MLNSANVFSFFLCTTPLHRQLRTMRLPNKKQSADQKATPIASAITVSLLASSRVPTAVECNFSGGRQKQIDEGLTKK